MSEIKKQEQVTQEYINNLIAELVRNYQKLFGTPRHDGNKAPIMITGIASSTDYFKDFDTQFPELFTSKNIHLASVSKIITALEQAILLQNQVSNEVEIKKDEYIDLLLEAINRDPKLEYIQRCSEQVFRILNRLVLPDNLKRSEIEEYIKEKINAIVTSDTYSIDVAEIIKLSLIQSNNTANRIINRLVVESKSELLISDGFTSDLVPSYERLVSTKDRAHWLQQRPNTGNILELQKLLKDKVHGYINNQLPDLEKAVIESLMNNPIDFGFCFTHSEKGKEFIDKGYKIFEKTGYYPCVYFVKDLTEMGFPPIIEHLNIVVIVDPDENIVNEFCQVDIRAVPIPWDVDSPDSKGRVTPDEFGMDYSGYIHRINESIRPEIRARMSERTKVSGTY